MNKKIKKLYRSKSNKIIAGVCGGFAEYLEVDPNVIRLLFVLLLLITAIIPCVIFYLIAAIIIPER